MALHFPLIHPPSDGVWKWSADVALSSTITGDCWAGHRQAWGGYHKLEKPLGWLSLALGTTPAPSPGRIQAAQRWPAVVCLFGPELKASNEWFRGGQSLICLASSIFSAVSVGWVFWKPLAKYADLWVSVGQWTRNLTEKSTRDGAKAKPHIQTIQIHPCFCNGLRWNPGSPTFREVCALL